MTVTVKHAKTNAISDWTQAQLDEQIALGNFAEGTVLADIVLPSDWNNDHTLTGVGTMAEQDANNVAITGGSINGTTIGATTASTGVFTTLTVNNTTGTSLANIWSNTNTSPIADLQFTRGTTSTWGGDVYTDYKLRASGGNFVVQSQNNATSVLDLLTFDEANNAVKFSPGGIEQARVSRTTSAVNYVQVTGSATGNRPAISAQGSDNPISLDINARGSAGTVRIGNALSTAFGIFQGVSGQTVVNYPTFIAGQTGFAIQTQATGTDTNISMAFQPKGTGAIDLAAGSRGVNISNGWTVTAITRTVAGTGYTSPPSVAITAPTTAGGVQATASTFLQLATTPTITSGGTGYTVNDVLTFVGGTIGLGANAAQVTVTSVSGGVITGISITTFGTGYSVVPTNPISVTGGTGSGATFTVTGWQVSGFTITNAGSGYIEQPTITFSGGGGSGAAAFAIVGGVTTIKGIGSSSPGNVANSILFSTPGGIGFSVQDRAATSVNYAAAIGNVTTQPGIIRSVGSDANVGLNLGTQGTGAITFSTNTTTSNIQMQVSHTASAVNYVQVTGSATTPSASTLPSISTQGSDTNTYLGIGVKGTGGYIAFYGAGGTNAQVLRISSANASSTNNLLQVSAAASGSAPILSSIGTDTNIDLALTPKGTGLVRFGTYVAGALTATGYINIKAADGTTYKVLVST